MPERGSRVSYIGNWAPCPCSLQLILGLRPRRTIHGYLADKRSLESSEGFRFRAALTRLAAEDLSVHRLMTDVPQSLKPSSVLRESTMVDRLARASQVLHDELLRVRWEYHKPPVARDRSWPL